MILYRATIRPIVSFLSPLQSDTLFGAFCWSYRYRFGEEMLEQFLAKMESEPAVIFSNAFPKGTLPLPLGVRDVSADFEIIESKTERKRAYQNHKKIKNARFVRREWFQKIADGTCTGFTQGLTGEKAQEQVSVHNMVFRQEGIVKQIDGSGNLYAESEFFCEAGQAYDIYVLSSLEPGILRDTVQLMFLLGIGRNKSTGKGAFELCEWQEERELAERENPNAFVALSNFVPSYKDPVHGWYKTLIKYGKLDREYAASENPFKKPILFLQAGAVFLTEEDRPYYGRCLKHVSVKENVVVNGHTIAIPLRLNL